MRIGQIRTKLCVYRFRAEGNRHLSHIRICRFRTATYKQKRTLISSSGGSTWPCVRAAVAVRVRADRGRFWAVRPSGPCASERTVVGFGPCASERAVRTPSWCDTNFLTGDMLLTEINFTFPSSQLKFESHATHRDLRLTSCN